MTPAIEDILDRCLEEARQGRDPEAILRQHADVAADVRPLLALAGELEALPAPQPSDGELARLCAHVAVAAAPAPARRFRRLRRALVAAAAALLLVVSGWVVLGAAGGAVPGDWLYPVKRVAEHTRYALTLAPEKRAELRVARSDERAKEAMLKHRRGEGLDPHLLRAMLVEAAHALDATSALPDASREVMLHRVACSCEFQCQMLDALKQGASPDELKVLKPFMAACDARCTCMEDATGGGDRTATEVAEVAGRLRELIPPVPAPR